MAGWPKSSENETQQGWEEENSFQIPILIWQTTASQTPWLPPRWGHNWWRRYTLGFFFFFFTLSSMESLSPFSGCVQFATIDLRLSLERNLFLSMGLSLLEDNIFTNGHLLIPYQETSSSGQNVFIPSSGAETLNKHCLFVPENWQFMHSPCQKWRRQLLFF